MSLSIDDLIKIKDILKEEFASKKDLSLSEKRIKSELTVIKDIIVGHDDYIRKEQRFVVKHLDENTKQMKLHGLTPVVSSNTSAKSRRSIIPAIGGYPRFLSPPMAES